MVKKIILVFKTHFDIGFTDLAENVIHSYGNEMLREVIETCNATEDLGRLRYVWTMPAWPLWYISRNCDPALKPELDRLIRNGQIVWHGLPFTSHTDFSAPDEYAETFRYSRELAETYGKPMPIAAKMTDVPGHGWMLPDILGQAGIRFLHLGCNEFATPPDVPPLFFWQGPGGGKVLTMYSKGGYGTGLLPPEDWPYPVWMALMHTHDNSGPQSAELILNMAKKAQSAYPEAEIVCGTMDDFYREMAQCDLSGIPVIAKDLADTWIHGVGSYPKEVSRMRQNRERARKLHSRYFEQLTKGGNDIPELEPLWEQYYDAVALFTEHTWGADVKTWLGPDRVYEKDEFLKAKDTPSYRFMERSWQEQRDRAARAERCLDKLEGLLGSERQAELRESSPLTVTQEKEMLMAENHRYRLLLDTRTGRIRSLIDLESGDALLEAGEESVFSYRYDRCGSEDVTEFLRSYAYRFSTWGIQDYGRENYPECPHETFYPGFLGWEAVGRELRLHYGTRKSSVDYGDAQAIHLTVAFPKTGDDLLLSLELENKQETPFIESGSFILPVPGKASYQIGKPGGVVDPEKDIERLCNHALFNLERQVTVRTEQGSLSVCSLDAPLFGIGSPGVYEYHKEFGQRKQVLYFNLFNNMWGTNFPQWIGGDLRYRFVLRSNAEAPQIWAAKLCRGETPGVPGGMELLRTKVADGIVYITLRDLTGDAEPRRLNFKGTELCEVDLCGNPTGAWEKESLTFRVRPWGSHVFAIKRKREA